MCSGRTPRPKIRAGMRRRNGNARNSFTNSGGFELALPGQHVADHALLHDDLDALGDACREFAPLLHLRQHVLADRAVAQRLGQDVGGGDRVLHREVDADAAERRHGMRGVADAEQAQAVPARHAVDRDGQKLDLVPVGDLAGAVGERRHRACDVGAERRQALAVHLFDRALRNDVGALPIVAAVEHDEDAPGQEPAAGLDGVVGAPAQPEPQHVHRRAELLDFKPRLLANDRVAAVAADRRAARGFRGGRPASWRARPRRGRPR